MARQVVVTGGTSGIGRAVAERFAAAGDRVTITGRDSARTRSVAAEIGGTGQVCDVTSAASLGDLARCVGGPVEVVVAMAGGNTDLGRAGDDSLDGITAAWQENLAVNLLGTVLTITALLPAVPRGGSIVTVGSIGAEYASTSYGAAKAAVAAWTAGLSARVGPDGITANTIAPGYVEGTDFFRGTLTDSRRGTLIDSTHTRRPGRTRDVAELVFFLASDGARQITGQTLHVNGGAHTTR